MQKLSINVARPFLNQGRNGISTASHGRKSHFQQLHAILSLNQLSQWEYAGQTIQLVVNEIVTKQLRHKYCVGSFKSTYANIVA